MKLIDVKPSTNKGKRLVAIVQDGEKIHRINFGSAGSSTFIDHKDEKKKTNYIKRHSVNEDWTNPLTAGMWARWILWEKPTLEESIKNVKRKFGL